MNVENLITQQWILGKRSHAFILQEGIQEVVRTMFKIPRISWSKAWSCMSLIDTHSELPSELPSDIRRHIQTQHTRIHKQHTLRAISSRFCECIATKGPNSCMTSRPHFRSNGMENALALFSSSWYTAGYLLPYAIPSIH